MQIIFLLMSVMIVLLLAVQQIKITLNLLPLKRPCICLLSWLHI